MPFERKVTRHYTALVNRSVFGPERPIAFEPLTNRKIFPLCDTAEPSRPSVLLTARERLAARLPTGTKIPKPPGTVGRPGPNREGYSLKTKLNWETTEYNIVLVSLLTRSLSMAVDADFNCQNDVHKLAQSDLTLGDLLSDQEVGLVVALRDKVSSSSLLFSLVLTINCIDTRRVSFPIRLRGRLAGDRHAIRVPQKFSRSRQEKEQGQRQRCKVYVAVCLVCASKG